MQARMVQHVSVWLDNQGADDSDFSHALTWALGLNVPLRVVATGFADPRRAVVERLRSWTAICIKKGVAMESHLACEATPATCQQFLRPGGICVFGDPAGTQRDRIAEACASRDVCQLIGVPAAAAVNRVLVLCHQATINAGYLETVAGLCQALDKVPTVLILGRTERDAGVKQGYVAGICNALRLEADFDLAVEGSMQDAVARAASWRGCSHIVVEREEELASVDVFFDLVQLMHAHNVSVFAVPPGAMFSVPQKVRSSRNVLSWGKPHDSERFVRVDITH